MINPLVDIVNICEARKKMVKEIDSVKYKNSLFHISQSNQNEQVYGTIRIEFTSKRLSIKLKTIFVIVLQFDYQKWSWGQAHEKSYFLFYFTLKKENKYFEAATVLVVASDRFVLFHFFPPN